jgi:hypothetical protein
MHFCCTAVILTALYCEDMQAVVAGSNWLRTCTNVETNYHDAVQQPYTAHNGQSVIVYPARRVIRDMLHNTTRPNNI